MSADAVLQMLNGQSLHYIDDSGSDLCEDDHNEAGDSPGLRKIRKSSVPYSPGHADTSVLTNKTRDTSINAPGSTLRKQAEILEITTVKFDEFAAVDDDEGKSTPVAVFLHQPDAVNFYEQRATHSANHIAHSKPDLTVRQSGLPVDGENDDDDNSSCNDDAASSIAPGTIPRRSPSMTPSSLHRATSSRAGTSMASSSSSDTIGGRNDTQKRAAKNGDASKRAAAHADSLLPTNITESRVMLPTSTGSNSVADFDADDSSTINNKSNLIVNRFGFVVGDNAPGTLRCLQYVERPLDARKVREREKKWLHMLSKWEYFMEKKFLKVRDRCRKGIPPSLRGRAWCHLCGAQFAMLDKPDLFTQLDQSEGDPQWVDLIERDVHRQFPTHELFMKRGGVGQTELLRLLKAYSVHRPEVGYCQAMAPVAATLLTQMPIQDAYYCFDAICSKYIADYYSPGLVEIQTDGEILTELLKRTSPRASRHMKKQGITYHQYMIEWFMCLFSRTLPWPTLLRVWDIFLCDDTPKTGIKFVFRVALVLLRDTLGHSDVKKQCPSDYDTLTLLKNLPASVVDENILVRNALELSVSDGDMYRAQQKVRKKRLKEEAAAAVKRAKSTTTTTASPAAAAAKNGGLKKN